jgi:hypothetical protein
MQKIGKVFIVGCPRSGTTLFQLELAKHNEIYSFPETHFFSKISLTKRSKILGILYANYILFKLINRLKRNCIFLKYKPKLSKKSLIDYFVSILDKNTIKNKKSIWIEKTPSHLRAIDFIEKHISDAIFIHVVRDGRDVVASLYEATNKYSKEWGGGYSIKDALDRYISDVQISEKYTHKSNHLYVRYEDLIVEKKKTLDKICEFLIINKNNFSDDSFYRGVVDNSEKWKKLNQSTKIIDTRGKKFNKIFTEKEQEYIELCLKNKKT